MAGSDRRKFRPPAIPTGSITPAQEYLVNDIYRLLGELESVKMEGGDAFAGLRVATRATTIDTTLTNEDVVLLVDAASGNRSVAMPTAVGIDGQVFIVKKIDATTNTVTINPAGSETIDGGSDAVLVNPQTSLTLVSDDANWSIH